VRQPVAFFPAFAFAGAVSGFTALAQALNARPDPADGCLRVLQLLRRLLARQAVQDRQQALGGPSGGQLCEFLLAGEGVKRCLRGGGGLFRGRKRHDFVLFVDRKSRHCESPLAALCAVMNIHHSEALESKGNSEINRQGRRIGDAPGADVAKCQEMSQN
jgi:hypothetical protein